MSQERNGVARPSRPTDVRSWLQRIDELGELQHVSGAHWELEIGTISEINYRRKPPAALLFDSIPGYPHGYRVLTGSLANARRMAVTLGLSDSLDTPGLVEALRGKPLEWEASASRFEPVVVDDASLADYKIPGLLDLPGQVSNHLVEVPHSEGPFGAKGVGESGTFAVSPAVANAIFDAVGVRLRELPLTPEVVFRALRAAQGEPLGADQ